MEGYYAKETRFAIGRMPSNGNDVHKERPHVTAMSFGKFWLRASVISSRVETCTKQDESVVRYIES